MARKIIKPALEDWENSVDLFDADRKNQWGSMLRVASCILYSQVEKVWQFYLLLKS